MCVLLFSSVNFCYRRPHDLGKSNLQIRDVILRLYKYGVILVHEYLCIYICFRWLIT